MTVSRQPTRDEIDFANGFVPSKFVGQEQLRQARAALAEEERMLAELLAQRRPLEEKHAAATCVAEGAQRAIDELRAARAAEIERLARAESFEGPVTPSEEQIAIAVRRADLLRAEVSRCAMAFEEIDKAIARARAAVVDAKYEAARVHLLVVAGEEVERFNRALAPLVDALTAASLYDEVAKHAPVNGNGRRDTWKVLRKILRSLKPLLAEDEIADAIGRRG